jgi:hypothetical protein
MSTATILCVISMLGLAPSAAQAPYEVGQYWQYNHQGPRPGATEPVAIDGQRILQVLQIIGSDAEQRWIIEDRFTNDPNIVGRAHVRDDRMITAIVIENEKGESLTLSYDQPLPYQTADLAVGASMQIKTELVTQPGGYKVPCTLQITRLDDQTIDTPAGRFPDCRVFRSVTDTIIDIKIAKIPFREQRKWWYSQSVGGIVKEIYTKDAVKFLTWSRDAYTATSTLSAYGIRGVSEHQQAAAIRDGNILAAPPAEGEAHANWKWPTVAICVVAAAIALRRFARTRSRHP